jgi:hypothetical protein
MSKEEALKLLMVLSSLESWAMACRIGVPDHERKKLNDAVDLLTKIVLEKTNEPTTQT